MICSTFQSPGGRLLREARDAWKRHPCDEERSEDTLEFIDLKFEHSVYVHGVYIYETLNPGSVVELWGGNCKGAWKRIWKGQASTFAGHRPRQFCPPVLTADFPVNQIRIHFDTQQIPYYGAIDGVCLLGTRRDCKESHLVYESIRYDFTGTTDPVATEAKLLASLPLPENRTPLMKEIVHKRLHLFDVDIERLALSDSFLAWPTITDKPGIDEENSTNFNVIESSNGFFDLLPREAIVHIFGYLDFLGLVQCRQVCSIFQGRF